VVAAMSFRPSVGALLGLGMCWRGELIAPMIGLGMRWKGSLVAPMSCWPSVGALTRNVLEG